MSVTSSIRDTAHKSCSRPSRPKLSGRDCNLQSDRNLTKQRAVMPFVDEERNLQTPTLQFAEIFRQSAEVVSAEVPARASV